MAASELAAYDRTFILDELFEEKKVSSREWSTRLYALGYERMSDAVKHQDPKKAATLQHQAMIYNSERHDTAAVSRNEKLIRQLSMTVNCWFCGREVCGENVHFMSMPSLITAPILSQADPDAPLATNSKTDIYACMACFSAIDNVGQEYYELGVKNTEEMVETVYRELMSEIRRLQSQINRLG